MDYGYQLLRHVFAQVFGNLPQAARITILPIVLAYVISGAILFGLTGPLMFELAAQGPAVSGQPRPNPFSSDTEAMAFAGRLFLGFIICLPVFLLFYAWAAVGWHRYVLLEELPSGLAARWSWPMIRGYSWALVRLSLMSILIMIGVGIVVSIVLSMIPSPEVALFLTISLTIGFTWMITRLGLILPSAALGTYMKMGESWATTAPVASTILLPIIVIPVAFFLLNSLTGFLGVIGIVLALVVFWLQTLVNLALMTTLFGNLVEGRQLN